jgi:hypothetical protein
MKGKAPLPYRFIVDKHIDAVMVRSEVYPAPVTPAWNRSARGKYAGEEPTDEDRNHVLQLSFERDSKLLSADGDILEKAYKFGPCNSNGHRLGGVIIVPAGKANQIAALRAFKNGSLQVQGIDPGSFDDIWWDNMGVDLRQKVPSAIELCECKFEVDVERYRKRYKRK